MRTFWIAILLIAGSFCHAQAPSFIIDTTSAASCKAGLTTEYKKKFEGINKNISSVTYAQKTIIKDLYHEIQDDFMDKIKDNNFICDDAVAPYLQGVMNEILDKNGIDKTQYKMLLSRDSDANAYNTGDGTIVVNYGLFLCVENEDELAAVISHEIGHQYLKHMKNSVETFAKLSTSEEVVKKTKEIRSQRYGKATKATDLLKNISYQSYSQRRKREIEADSIGYIFYKKTARSERAPVTVLEKLDLSDEEKDTLSIADYKAIFEKNGYTVKKKYFDAEESLFSKYEDDKRINIDSLKSHPACPVRIKIVNAYLGESKAGTAPKNSPAFTAIKDKSEHQNLVNLYIGERYGISLYEALKLFKNQPDDVFLKSIIIGDLEKLRDARNTYTINRYLPGVDHKKNTESFNRFILFVQNIKMADFDILINNLKS